MVDRSQLELLVGKYFIATFRIGMGELRQLSTMSITSSVSIPAVTAHPRPFAVVALDDMVRAGREDEEEGPAHWLFFDSADDRAKFRAWMETPEDPNKPRVVPLRRY
jgi:hypothetical protein